MDARDRPYDLLGVTATFLLAALAAALPPGLARTALATPAVMLAPGYALVSLLQPERALGDGRAQAQRLLLALAGSVAIVPVALLPLAVARMPLTLPAVLVAIALVTLPLAGLAARRRARLAREECPRVLLPRPARPRRSTLAAGGLALLLAAGSLAYVAARPVERDGFLVLYALDERGAPLDPPLQLRAGDAARLVLGVASHEPKEVACILAVSTQHLRVASSENGTLPASRGVDARQLLLPPGEEGRVPVTLELSQAGPWRLIVELRCPRVGDRTVWVDAEVRDG